MTRPPSPGPPAYAIRHVVCYADDVVATAVTRVAATVLGAQSLPPPDPSAGRIPTAALVVVAGRFAGRLLAARRAGFRGPALVLAGPGDDGRHLRTRRHFLRWHPPAHAVWPEGARVVDLLPRLAGAGPIPPDCWRLFRYQLSAADRFFRGPVRRALAGLAAAGRPWPDRHARVMHRARQLCRRAPYASHDRVDAGGERGAVNRHVAEWLARNHDGPPPPDEADLLLRLFEDWCRFAGRSGELVGDPPPAGDPTETAR